MAKAYCPNCDSVISVENPRMGAMITCGDCGQELETISVNPFEVDFPLEDDWDYEEEDDEG
jgi:lysine biosynthesis protein LysW